MKNTKKIVAVLLMLVLVISLFGCGEKPAEPAPAPAPAPADPATPSTPADPAPAPAPADPEVTISMGLTFTMEDYRGMDLQYFCDTVTERTNGTVKFDLHPSESLVKGSEALSAMILGTIDAYMCGAAYLSGSVEGIDAMELPVLANCPNLVDRLQLMYDVVQANRDVMEQGFTKAGVELIGVVAQGGYVDMIFKEPVTTAEEYEGHLIRTTGGVGGELVQLAGSTSVAIGSADLYLGLQTGTVDAAMTTPSSIRSNKLYELCPYMVTPSISNSFSPYYLVINTAKWAELSENQQKIMREVADETLKRTVEIYPEEQSVTRNEVLEHMTELVLPAEEWNKIAKKLSVVWDEKAAGFGDIDRAIYESRLEMEGLK